MDSEILHERFSILTLLLTLVTALNHGHPTLDVKQKSDRERQTRPHIMEALLAVLVQDSQILACMAYGNGGGLVVRDQGAERVTGDEPADEHYRIPEGPSLLRIATINNGELGPKMRDEPKDKLAEIIAQFKKLKMKKLKKLKIFGANKQGGATQDQVQSQEAGGATKYQGQLQEQEAGEDDELQKYSLLEPGHDLWALGEIEDAVGIGKLDDYR
jgi:hypothetical protein